MEEVVSLGIPAAIAGAIPAIPAQLATHLATAMGHGSNSGNADALFTKSQCQKVNNPSSPSSTQIGRASSRSCETALVFVTKEIRPGYVWLFGSRFLETVRLRLDRSVKEIFTAQLNNKNKDIKNWKSALSKPLAVQAKLIKEFKAKHIYIRSFS